jgi:EAL domain-containing protein (putative c-di-GMP-specific phosphodiesterase class I)
VPTTEKLSWTQGGGGSDADASGIRSLTVSDIGVVFQPIVDMRSGVTFAHEALVRCRRPEYAAPPILFQHAVDENACGRLGRLIREEAFATCGEVPLFVNVHPDELSSRWLVRPDDPLCFHAAPVFLEITESAAFTHFDLCRSVLRELCRRTGALLVVDDFGAGHSNLERVVDLEPSIVKLDLALIRGIHRHHRKRAVVRHLVNLCKELGARVVAEGIETIDELSCLRDLSVDYAQGYLLARPAAPPPQINWPLDVTRTRGADPKSGSRGIIARLPPAGPPRAPGAVPQAAPAPARARPPVPPAPRSQAPSRRPSRPKPSKPPRGLGEEGGAQRLSQKPAKPAG